MSPVVAHGIGEVRDPALPDWLMYYGGAVALVLSFVALAALWTRPLLEPAASGRRLPDGLQRVVLSRALRVVLGLIGSVLLVVAMVAGIVGPSAPLENFTPTFVWIVFWLGLVPLVVVFGNVWAWLSPFRALADAVAWLARRAGLTWQPLPYPERAGRWPAAALLFAFVAFELAYWDASNPRALALAIYLYALSTWAGTFLFGREAWTQNGEAFHSYFGLLARIAPFAVVENEGRKAVVARPPLTGLARVLDRPGTVPFVAVMLGSVAFDSISRTRLWIDLRVELELARAGAGLVNVLGLAATVAAVALLFLAAVRVTRRFGPERVSLADAFVASLVPIALVYAVAHYLSLLIGQGRYIVALASDPFGRGWDLFGTVAFEPDLTPLGANALWYTQVAVLVLGHIAGLVLAHDRAVALFGSSNAATRSQLPMLALMVLYTAGGLWLLSSG